MLEKGAEDIKRGLKMIQRSLLFLESVPGIGGRERNICVCKGGSREDRSRVGEEVQKRKDSELF